MGNCLPLDLGIFAQIKTHPSGRDSWRGVSVIFWQRQIAYMDESWTRMSSLQQKDIFVITSSILCMYGSWTYLHYCSPCHIDCEMITQETIARDHWPIMMARTISEVAGHWHLMLGFYPDHPRDATMANKCKWRWQLLHGGSTFALWNAAGLFSFYCQWVREWIVSCEKRPVSALQGL